MCPGVTQVAVVLRFPSTSRKMIARVYYSGNAKLPLGVNERVTVCAWCPVSMFPSCAQCSMVGIHGGFTWFSLKRTCVKCVLKQNGGKNCFPLEVLCWETIILYRKLNANEPWPILAREQRCSLHTQSWYDHLLLIHLFTYRRFQVCRIPLGAFHNFQSFVAPPNFFKMYCRQQI